MSLLQVLFVLVGICSLCNAINDDAIIDGETETGVFTVSSSVVGTNAAFSLVELSLENEEILSLQPLNLMTVGEALELLQKQADMDELVYVGVKKPEQIPSQMDGSIIAAANSHKYGRRLGEEGIEGEDLENNDTWFYWSNTICALVCVVVAALAAGLTMGLLSIDMLTLLIKERAGSTDLEKEQAQKLLPIVKDHHRLLVTLLLLNSIANEALPIFLDAVVPSYVAIILSVTLLLFFGEIIPSALFTGPEQIAIASKLVPLVRLVMLLLCPIAVPIAKMLDYFLHDEEEASAINLFNRGELAALIKIQYEERLASKTRNRSQMIRMASKISASKYSLDVIIDHDGEDEEHQNDNSSRSLREAVAKYEVSQSMRSLRRAENHSFELLHVDEVGIAESALHLGTKVAIDVYQPLAKVYGIPLDATLNEERVVEIYSSGYSRIPVFEKDKFAIRGVLMTKQLVVISPSDERKVDTIPLMQPICVSPQHQVIKLINEFQTGGHANIGGHLAIVCSKPQLANDALDKGLAIPKEAGVIGIVTFEDVLEELLSEEIFDEMDHAERSAGRTVAGTIQQWWKARQLEKMKKLASKKKLKASTKPGGKSMKQLESVAIEAVKAAKEAAEASSKTAQIAAKLATKQDDKQAQVELEKDAAVMAVEAEAASKAAATAAAQIEAVETTLEGINNDVHSAEEPTSITSPLLKTFSSDSKDNATAGGNGNDSFYGSTAGAEMT